MATALVERMQHFFDTYASASLSGDAKAVSGAYFPTYLEAGPAGVEAFRVDDDYRKALGSKAAAMAAMGLSRSAVSVEAVTAIAANCVLVDTEWRLRFEPADRPAAETAFHISYVVRDPEGNPQILLAISHEDEQQLLADLGLGGPGDR